MSPFDITHHAPSGGHHQPEVHFSRRDYLVGFALSALLTAGSFWLVMTNALHDAGRTIVAIMVMAVAQILVQTAFFLHVNRRAEGGWTLVAIVFTAVLLLILVTGSLWIMYHLNTNMMMPMPAATQASVP
jgi:cytochrome o ubiquinol oxidase operon protein cyoD